MRRILLTGSNGLLGQRLVDLFSRLNSYNILLVSRQPESVFGEETLPYIQLDLAKRQDVRNVVDDFEPDVIINTAAMTDVDRCESERANAWHTNVAGVENLVGAAKLVGARIIQISTDYIFDGKNGPYSELDRPGPLNYYGRTKLAAENFLTTSGIPHLILRTSILYGMGTEVKVNFGIWLLRNLTGGKPIRVAGDQTGNPTLADDVAYAVIRGIELERTGIYHVSGPDLVSRYDFAVTFAEQFSLNKKLITPVQTAALKQEAARPLKSGFITLKAETDLGIRMSGIERGIKIFRNQVEAVVRRAKREELF